MWLIDLEPDGSLTDQWLPLPVVRPLAVVTGSLAGVLVEHPDLTGHYLSVVLTDAVRPLEPMRRLREQFPYALTVTWEPAGERGAAVVRSSSATATDADILADFLLDCRGCGASATEQALIDAALSAERIAEVVG